MSSSLEIAQKMLESMFPVTPALRDASVMLPTPALQAALAPLHVERIERRGDVLEIRVLNLGSEHADFDGDESNMVYPMPVQDGSTRHQQPVSRAREFSRRQRKRRGKN
jgi:hypothetical protein